MGTRDDEYDYLFKGNTQQRRVSTRTKTNHGAYRLFRGPRSSRCRSRRAGEWTDKQRLPLESCLCSANNGLVGSPPELRGTWLEQQFRCIHSLGNLIISFFPIPIVPHCPMPRWMDGSGRVDLVLQSAISHILRVWSYRRRNRSDGIYRE